MKAARALLLCLLALAGCGRSYSQICSNWCSRVVNCIGGNQQSLMNCQAACTGQDYNNDNCTDDSLSKKWSCIDHCNGYGDCGQWGSCAANCPACIKK